MGNPSRLLLLIIGLLLITNASANTTDSNSSPVVIELFTSQGCYSCPPADAVLGKLKHRNDVIALSCHVTYWNYLGWRDTFSLRFCDQRQRHYQRSLKGNPGVYTPQMVVNGVLGLVGSRQHRVEKAMALASDYRPLQSIGLSQPNNNTLHIQLPQLETNTEQQLWLLGTSGEHHLAIATGENGGKQLHYHNPVATVIDLGRWHGQASGLKHVVDNAGIREWVVVAQVSPLGAISAAGKLALNSE